LKEAGEELVVEGGAEEVVVEEGGGKGNARPGRPLSMNQLNKVPNRVCVCDAIDESVE
jgi:hypothetical protein